MRFPLYALRFTLNASRPTLACTLRAPSFVLHFHLPPLRRAESARHTRAELAQIR